MENCRENALVLKQGLEKTGRFNILSKDIGVPLVAFSLKDSSYHDEFEVADLLRRFGWIVPAYTMPANAEHVTVLRVVVREDFSRTLAERLVNDIVKVLNELDTLPGKLLASPRAKETVEGKKMKDVETLRVVTEKWKKYVLEKKKMNKIC